MVRRILLSVWFLGLAFSIPVILLLPDLFNKYMISLVFQEPAAQPENYRIFFRDLDRTGEYQKVYSFRNRNGQLSCQYFNDTGGMVNQIDFPYRYTQNSPFLFFGDANRDGKTEIYGFTISQDSLFLNWAELSSLESYSMNSVFISRIGIFEKNKIDFSIARFNIIDLDNDGSDEIVFSVVTGQSLFPRMVVVFHPESGRVIKSEDTGINPYFMIYYDLNRDGNLEILTGSNVGYAPAATGGEEMIFDRPYVQAFDKELKPVWTPIPLSRGFENNLHIMPLETNRKEILVFQFNRSRPRDKIVGAYTFDFQGNVRDSAFFPEYGKRFRYNVYPFEGKYRLYTGDKVVTIDDDLRVISENNIEPSVQIFRNFRYRKGLPEIATTDLFSQKLSLYTEDFRYSVKKLYQDERIRSVIMDYGLEPDCFFVQTDHNEYTYKFHRNRLYYLKIPVYLLIYLVSVFFVWLIRKIYDLQLREKYEMIAQMRELEIKSLRMQMDPHFMFNAFNSMALLLKNDNREEAYDAFMKFARMVRSNFDFSDRLTRPLSEEIELTRQYLELNQLRFKDKLEYSLNVGKEVPLSMLIPKMMLQIHVENALKHGIAKLEKRGRVTIGLFMDNDNLKVTIIDNGVGRQAAALGNQESTRQGLKMLKAIYDRLGQKNKIRIVQVITDLKDDNQNPAVTRIDITIPVDIRENREQESTD